MQTPFKILSTRKLSTQGKAILKENDFVLEEESFISTERIEDKELSEMINALAQQKVNVIFTSKNAVKAVAEILLFQPKWNIYCIEGNTRETIDKYFTKVKILDSAINAKALAEKIIQKQPAHIVFFCGNKRMNTIPDTLLKAAFHLQEVIVYNTVITSKKLSKEYDGIIFFSPSAVESFFKKNTVLPCTKLFSIGPNTTNALRHFSSNIYESKYPGEKEIVETILTFATK